MTTTTTAILDEILEERKRQDQKWGPQNRSIPEWVTILAEEFGEAARGANELHFRPNLDPARFFPYLRAQEQVRRELIQVAAVAVAMVEQLDNGEARVR